MPSPSPVPVSSVCVSTSAYQFSHGKTPRGRGYWGFEVAGDVVWSKNDQTYRDAKADACKVAAARGVRVVKVCP